MATPDRYSFGEFVLERSQQRVLRSDGTPLRLTPRLFSALLLFVERAGALLDKDSLMQALWPGLVVEENNLNQVVLALRRALGDESRRSRFIETVPRRGFRFIAAVTVLPDAPMPAPAAAPVAAVPDARYGRRRWLQWVAAGSSAAGLASLGWWLGRKPSTAMGEPIAGVTLAVLPFKPLHTAERDELLEIGMADSLITRLSLVPGLVVRSAGSVLRYAGPAQDPLRAARELNVAWIVDGTLQRQGDQLRASARLLDAADGRAVWSGSFDERFVGVFDVQDQISARVAQALASALHVSPGANAHLAELGGTQSVEAYQLYLAAGWRSQDMRGDSTGRAIALLQRALELDPSYALAWALLAWAHRRRLFRNDARPREVFEAADAALERALALAPRLAQARAGRGYSLHWYRYDWAGAEAEYRSAVALNPSDASARLGLALLMLPQGRLDEGFAQMRLARELDPMSPVMNALEASFLLDAGRLDQARARIDRALDIAPQNGLAQSALGLVLLAEGQPDKGIAALRRAAELTDGSARPRAVLAMHLAAHGRREEVRAILDGLRSEAERHYMPPTTLAIAHAALGDTAAALEALERAFVERDNRLIFFKNDPSWTVLRKEPRFLELQTRLGQDPFGRGLTPV